MKYLFLDTNIFLHFEDFEERADESEGTMYEFTALSHDARGHSVEHLEQKTLYQ